MFIVGLTGGIASGKTTATSFFMEKGINIIDADDISRELQQSGSKAYEEIVTKFGKKILRPNKEIDRTILREMAFSDINTRKWLEDLMHPLIKEETIKRFSDTKSKWAIYSAPLWSKENIFNRTLVIDAPKDIQIKRLLQRDNCSEKTAIEMIEAQLQSNERNNFASDLIINDDSIEIFKSKLDFYFNLYNKLADE
tara:strand:- start:158 stop:745 length:588 start_codon:yes stop_codon:yes gene_type:complete